MQRDLTVETLTAPRRFDVVLTRIKGHPETNVPRSAIWHSPDGFEWGYGGSGPADLALNILNAFVPPGTDDYAPVKMPVAGRASRTAVDLHQAFKWEFLATLPTSGGAIEADTIMRWLNKQLRDSGLLPAAN